MTWHSQLRYRTNQYLKTFNDILRENEIQGIEVRAKRNPKWIDEQWEKFTEYSRIYILPKKSNDREQEKVYDELLLQLSLKYEEVRDVGTMMFVSDYNSQYYNWSGMGELPHIYCLAVDNDQELEDSLYETFCNGIPPFIVFWVDETEFPQALISKSLSIIKQRTPNNPNYQILSTKGEHLETLTNERYKGIEMALIIAGFFFGDMDSNIVDTNMLYDNKEFFETIRENWALVDMLRPYFMRGKHDIWKKQTHEIVKQLAYQQLIADGTMKDSYWMRDEYAREIKMLGDIEEIITNENIPAKKRTISALKRIIHESRKTPEIFTAIRDIVVYNGQPPFHNRQSWQDIWKMTNYFYGFVRRAPTMGKFQRVKNYETREQIINDWYTLTLKRGFDELINTHKVTDKTVTASWNKIIRRVKFDSKRAEYTSPSTADIWGSK